MNLVAKNYFFSLQKKSTFSDTLLVQIEKFIRFFLKGSAKIWKKTRTTRKERLN
jgi:hypothetical protein